MDARGGEPKLRWFLMCKCYLIVPRFTQQLFYSILLDMDVRGGEPKLQWFQMCKCHLLVPRFAWQLFYNILLDENGN